VSPSNNYGVVLSSGSPYAEASAFGIDCSRNMTYESLNEGEI
jgi:hypothetical protein